MNKTVDVVDVDFNTKEGKGVYWHSTSHIMAQAVKKLFPGAKYAIGPAIKEGFYYDFEVEKPFTDDDLEKIEKEMARIVAEGLSFSRKEVPVDEAIQHFKGRNDPLTKPSTFCYG